MLSLEEVLEKAAELVNRDRYHFLESIDEQMLLCGTFLDLQHQTIFRVLSEAGVSFDCDNIQEYLQHPTTRLTYLQAAKDYTLGQSREGLQKTGISKANLTPDKTRGGSSYKSSRNEIIAAFSELLRGFDPCQEQVLYFITNLGFACFPKDDSLDRNLVTWLNGTKYSSVGAMMYYGFNLQSTGQAYLQKDIIHILAKSILSQIFCLQEARIEYPFPQSFVNSELINYSSMNRTSLEAIQEDLFEFFTLHEMGHNPKFAGNKLLFELLDKYHISHTDFYSVDFPSREDLDSWHKIQLGLGTPKNVLFLLGDFLANIAILEAGISKSSLKLLQVFNWWLTKEPTQKKRPRGSSNFIYQSYGYDHELFIKDMDPLLQAAKTDPGNLCDKFLSFEFNSWERLLNFMT